YGLGRVGAARAGTERRDRGLAALARRSEEPSLGGIGLAPEDDRVRAVGPVAVDARAHVEKARVSRRDLATDRSPACDRRRPCTRDELAGDDPVAADPILDRTSELGPDVDVRSPRPGRGGELGEPPLSRARGFGGLPQQPELPLRLDTASLTECR